MEEMTNSKEFVKLLESLVKEQTITVPNTNGETYKFQTLTANQLKLLMQSLVDKSLTNLSFNSTLLRIMKENFAEENTAKPIEEFNIIDKILFLLAIRIEAVSDKVYILGEDNKPFEVDLKQLTKNVLAYTKITGQEKLEETVISFNDIKAIIGVPFANVEYNTNEEVYKSLDLKEEKNKLEETIGSIFIAELTKWVKALAIENNLLDFTSLPLNEKVKALESLPASLVEQIIEFVETTKKDIDTCLTVNNKVLPLDGSLFSVR